MSERKNTKKEKIIKKDCGVISEKAVQDNSDKNGGIKPPVDGENKDELKGASSLPPERETVREETSILRRLAFRVAEKAGNSIEKKDEWNQKDFELAIGTWAKIVGVETKLEGDADGMEKLIDELTEGDEHPDAI